MSQTGANTTGGEGRILLINAFKNLYAKRRTTLLHYSYRLVLHCSCVLSVRNYYMTLAVLDGPLVIAGSLTVSCPSSQIFELHIGRVCT